MSAERRRILLAELQPLVPAAIEYATWNPADKAPSIALSAGDLTATKSAIHATEWACVRASVPMKVGQWYWEVTVVYGGTANFMVGLNRLDSPLDQGAYIIGVNRAGQVNVYGTIVGNIGAIASGTVLRFWYDMDAQQLHIAKDGGPYYHFVRNQFVVPAAGICACVGIVRPSGSSVSCTANFGGAPFAHSSPRGAAPGVFSVSSADRRAVYLGSEGFNTLPGDVPASTHYMGRIAGDMDVDITSELSCAVWSNQTAARGGALEVINIDGGLDEWIAWQWRDTPYTLWSGYEGDSRAAFTRWSSGVVDRIEATGKRRFRLTFADPLVLFDRALQLAMYPADQANAQLAGQPKRIVIGRPLYCDAALLNTAPTARDYELHDGVAVDWSDGQLAGIDAIYDKGSRFAGPDDPYVPSSPITGVNGGDFGGWSGAPAMPTNWVAITPFTATNRFGNPGFGLNARCQSDGSAYAVMLHTAVLQPGRYVITFNVVTLTKTGMLYFRVDGGGGIRADTSFAITTAGSKSLSIDVLKAGQLQLAVGNLFGPDLGVDIVIGSLRANSQQVIDWTYWPNVGSAVGFHLANKPEGKVVANPRGPRVRAAVVAELLTDVAMGLGNRTWSGDPNALDPPQIDSGSLALLEEKAPYRLARFLHQPVTLLTLYRELLDSFCAGLTVNRAGHVLAQRVEEPAMVPDFTLDDATILGDVAITLDTAPGLSQSVAGRRNHSPHADADIVWSASPALKAELTTEWTCIRSGAAGGDWSGSDRPVSPAYIAAAQAPPIETWLQDPADIQAHANYVCSLWRPQRAFYTLTALLDRTVADGIEPGQTVRVVWSRIKGMENGMHLLVKRVRRRFFSRRVELQLWGLPPPVSYANKEK